MKNLKASLVAVAIAAGGASVAQAATLDCSVTVGVCGGASGTVVSGGNTYYQFAGALWTTNDFQSTGTGVIDSFVRISDNADVVSGMNTSARPLTQDENSSPTFTSDITAATVPIVTIGTNNYYEFLLDINQTNNDPKISLSQLELCSSASGNQTITATATTCAGTNFYSLDASGNNNVLLNYLFNNGSGSGDLFVYIPVPTTPIPGNNFIYLYSQFGEPPPDGNNDGFEEWARRVPGTVPCPDCTPTPFNPAVPEPASVVLLGTGLLGLAFAARRKNGKAKA